MKKVLLVGLIIGAAIALSATSSGAQAQLEEPVVSFLEVGLDEAQQTFSRSSVGLPERVSGPIARESIEEYGLELTDSELRELRLREAVRAQVSREKVADALGDRFGGMFTDHEGGGNLVVLVAGDQRQVAEAQAMIESMTTDKEAASRIETRQVDYSFDELETLTHNIADEVVGKQRLLEGVGIEVTTNSLFVVMSPQVSREKDGAQAMDAVTRVLANSRSFNADLSITVEVGENSDSACTVRHNCGGTSNRRGGVDIQHATDTRECTSGFAVIEGSDEDIITAGHCWFGTNSGEIETGTGAQNFGFLSNENALEHNSVCDCRIISTTNSSTRNRYYRTNNNRNRKVTSVDFADVGDFVRLFGANTQSTGTVTRSLYDYWGSTCGCIVRGSTIANYAEDFGDSGAPVTMQGFQVAAGIHSGSSLGQSRFFRMANVLTELNVTVLTTD